MDTNRSITERVNAHASRQVSKQPLGRGCRRHVDQEQHNPGFVIVCTLITHKNEDKKEHHQHCWIPTTSTRKKTLSEHLQNGKFIFANKVKDSHSRYGRLRELSFVFHIGLKCDSFLWWLAIEFVRGCSNTTTSMFAILKSHLRR